MIENDQQTGIPKEFRLSARISLSALLDFLLNTCNTHLWNFEFFTQLPPPKQAYNDLFLKISAMLNNVQVKTPTCLCGTSYNQSKMNNVPKSRKSYVSLPKRNSAVHQSFCS